MFSPNHHHHRRSPDRKDDTKTMLVPGVGLLLAGIPDGRAKLSLEDFGWWANPLAVHRSPAPRNTSHPRGSTPLGVLPIIGIINTEKYGGRRYHVAKTVYSYFSRMPYAPYAFVDNIIVVN